jgi:peptide-methionine (S)-S-oxide reductase
MTRETAMFGAGCFWGVEHAFRQVDGVLETAVGFAGGTTENPTYEQVCTDQTGHAEVVLVEFDPAAVTFEMLLETFFGCHDPTQRNRQGPDIGRQYRSVVFAFSKAQRDAAERAIEALASSGRFKKPIVTEVKQSAPFYRAEEYHQRYIEKNGGAACGI